jgi:hypothetical protein
MQVGELVQAARQTQASIDALKAAAQQVLQTVVKSPPLGLNGHATPPAAPGKTEPWIPVIFDLLARWQDSGSSEDFPLPELHRRTRAAVPHLTIGQFHDGLRRLHDQEQIYLHPWTGPLCEMPEPSFALLIGHEIAYYASIRK